MNCGELFSGQRIDFLVKRLAGYGWKFGGSSCLFFSLVIPRDRGFAFLSVAILANESDHCASQLGAAPADAGARALRLMGCLLRRVMSGTLAVVQWAAHTYRGVLRPSKSLPLCEEPESERHVRACDRWARLVRAASRLAFCRRVWGLLGGLLREVKQRGQLAIRGLR